MFDTITAVLYLSGWIKDAYLVMILVILTACSIEYLSLLFIAAELT